MDERREEREELAALERDDVDDARRVEEERRYWTNADGLEWAEVVMLESEAWSR